MLFGSLGALLLAAGTVCGLELAVEYFILNRVIGDRTAFILTTIFMLGSGFGMFLFCFFAYQIKALRREMFRLQFEMRQRGK